jgi:diaminohydroxyphosphoribosylaminopyrimidine deaminase / 5-amino-6-(5-phosphoribosylamino)uracil reductase
LSASSVTATSDADLSHMDAALHLARRGLGNVWPNPAVGCVIVKDGHVVGRGWTQAGGRPHAETEALERAGDAARGATVYVTLEPCSHHGRTPPCADALIAAGVSRVVAALDDPDPRVSGSGFAKLRDAGIAVVENVRRREAADLNDGFLRRVRAGRPLVTFKMATTLDGRIATHKGESRWITGETARAQAHALRLSHDAILVGSGTATADNPMLDIRLPGTESAKRVRAVVDGRLRTQLTSKLVASAKDVPTWFFVRADADAVRAKVFADCGVELVHLPPEPSGFLAPGAILAEMGKRGLTRVLLEGGGYLAAAFLRADLIDRIVRFGSGTVIGGDGLAVVAPFGIDRLANAPKFVRTGVSPCGEDVLESWTRAT